jgi:hypothetical protein
MYLKKVEACCFKSFIDKTVLSFEQGISGIIGLIMNTVSLNISKFYSCILENKSQIYERLHTARRKLYLETFYARSTTRMDKVFLIFDIFFKKLRHAERLMKKSKMTLMT